MYVRKYVCKDEICTSARLPRSYYFLSIYQKRKNEEPLSL